MAPEILARDEDYLGYQGYQGHAVDLFALGVILFILYSAKRPFKLANLNDPYYAMIAFNMADKFW